jgi:cytochrome P450
LWKRLRAAAPVHWTEGNLSTGFWLLTRYADVLAVYTDPVTASRNMPASRTRATTSGGSRRASSISADFSFK